VLKRFREVLHGFKVTACAFNYLKLRAQKNIQTLVTSARTDSAGSAVDRAQENC
jgi:hypothetical protein